MLISKMLSIKFCKLRAFVFINLTFLYESEKIFPHCNVHECSYGRM